MMNDLISKIPNSAKSKPTLSERSGLIGPRNVIFQ